MSLNLVDLTIIITLLIGFVVCSFTSRLNTSTKILIISIIMFLTLSSELFRVLELAILSIKLFGLEDLDFSKLFKQQNDEKLPKLSNDIDAIVEATSDMAKNNVGALIIVAEEDGDDIGKFGTTINANISRELLENIFVPNTPLHDGAVVVTENGRISTAGSVIPLSESDDDKSLPKDAGTRHRAALSASKEDNVGVCVLVSEERGDISIAIDGVIYSGLSKEKLRDMLVEHTSLTNK